MVIRVWGIINSIEVEFHPIKDRPYYWEGYAPRIKGLQNIDIWAENDRGAKGHLKTQIRIEWNSPTIARLIITPYTVTFIPNWRVFTMLESTDFILGEKKQVSIIVKSICEKPFEVTDARYFLKVGDEIESSGECFVEQIQNSKSILSALIQPMRKNAIYDLNYSYTIYPEKLLYTVKIRVN